MAKSNIKTNAMRILDKEKIQYSQHQYDSGGEAIDGVSVAKLIGMDPVYVFKTLVTVSSAKEYFVFVVPVEHELDLKKAAKAVGAKAVNMIHVKEINAVTGYIRGGTSPVGMKKKYPTVIHNSAENLEKIIFSGGKIGYQIEMAPKDLIKVTDAIFADIVKE
ncbi:MAG: Cys-tRNA(Pro) deacylase [Anaerofustis stercorihominis]|nr:Cys-tRNA(Pro) deacylase [Anaerofustis stercorihominis]